MWLENAHQCQESVFVTQPQESVFSLCIWVSCRSSKHFFSSDSHFNSEHRPPHPTMFPKGYQRGTNITQIRALELGLFIFPHHPKTNERPGDLKTFGPEVSRDRKESFHWVTRSHEAAVLSPTMYEINCTSHFYVLSPQATSISWVQHLSKCFPVLQLGLMVSPKLQDKQKLSNNIFRVRKPEHF